MDNAVIEIKDASVAYRENVALAGITLTVFPGEFIGIIGPNGAGKTTLLTLVNGLAKAVNGSVTVFGRDVKMQDAHALRRRVGYVSQAADIDPRTPMSVRDVVMTGRAGLGLLRRPGKNDAELISEMLGFVGMTGLAERPIGHLSGGERQRTAIARCLAQEPEILLLDEPTASLDWPGRTEILELVRRIHDTRRLTTLFVTHDLDALPAACTRILLMKGGHIIADGVPLDVLSDSNLAGLYGLPLAEVKERRAMGF